MIFKPAQIEKYIKSGEPVLKAAVIYGSNEGLVSEYVKKFIGAVSADLYDPFQVVYLNGSEVNGDPGLMYGEYGAQSLMGGRRVIVIRDADNNLTKHLKAMLETTESDSLLVIYSGGLNKKSSLVALAESREDMAAVACYEDRDEDIFATARSMLVTNGVTIGNEALQLLCARLSNDRLSNIGEIEKLITYLGERKNATPEDIRAAVSDQSNTSTEDICYYSAGGYSEKSQTTLRKLLNEGEEPIAIIRSLTYHFNKILTCQAAMEKGESAEKALYKLTPRIIFFRESSFKRQLALWPKDKVLSVLELLYKCERDCKTTGMPTEEIVSYCLLQISSAAARLSKGA